MKTSIAILFFAFVSWSATAAETDSKQNVDRYVADDMEIQVSPSGEVVARLVSKNRVTARQFWVDSVYHSQRRIVVFQGYGGLTQTPILTQGELGKQRISQNDGP